MQGIRALFDFPHPPEENGSGCKKKTISDFVSGPEKERGEGHALEEEKSGRKMLDKKYSLIGFQTGSREHQQGSVCEMPFRRENRTFPDLSPLVPGGFHSPILLGARGGRGRIGS